MRYLHLLAFISDLFPFFILFYFIILFRNDMDRAYWFVCLAAFVTSPFITNDGLCLLMVDPILDAFLIPATPLSQVIPKSKYSFPLMEYLCGSGKASRNENVSIELNRRDHKSNRFFFLLGIACSANIGSAMTFTGNPQNIIIAGYLEDLMNGGMFFLLMIPPAVVSWLITCYYINVIRLRTIQQQIESADRREIKKLNSGITGTNLGFLTKSLLMADEMFESRLSVVSDIDDFPVIEGRQEKPFYPPDVGDDDESVRNSSSSNFNDDVSGEVLDGGESGRGHNGTTKRTHPVNVVTSKIAEEIGSYSWVAFPLFAVLIVLELVGIITLVALYTLVAIFIIASVVLVNYYRGYPVRWPNGNLMTRRDRIQLIIKYVEDMFNDLDYNLIVIFSGLFIVAGSFVRTGIPSAVWDAVAGSTKTAFRSGTSLFLISLYTIIASQLIGNVAVIIMASPEMVKLDPDIQKFGWLMLAWVSTVAGNFTLAGSAANIIVAEKAFRHGNKKIASGESTDAHGTGGDAFKPPILATELGQAPRGTASNANGSSTPTGTAGTSGGGTVSGQVYPPAPISAKLKITSYEHFKICGLLTLLCILLGTVMLYAECKSLGFI